MNIYDKQDTAITVVQPDNPLEVISLFETNKAARQRFVDYCLQSIEDGNSDPLKLHIALKKMEEVVKSITGSEPFKKAVLDAAEKFGQRSFKTHEAEVSIKEVGSKWEYDLTQDEAYFNMLKEMEALKTRIKQREAFLQSVPSAGMADPETGAMVYPATKTSTTGIAIKLL